jgi:Putative Ig domain
LHVRWRGRWLRPLSLHCLEFPAPNSNSGMRPESYRWQGVASSLSCLFYRHDGLHIFSPRRLQFAKNPWTATRFERPATIIASVSFQLEMRLKPGRAFTLLLCCFCLCGAIASAQQGAATGEPIVIRTTGLPKAYLKQHYETRLEAQGGITPLRWELKDGTLPAGIVLVPDGILSGVPTETGEFKFTVTVTDSGRPAAQRNQQFVLTVVAPLFAQWGRYPKVNGHRLEGSILVSNQTGQDFDLTVIVMAVNDIGRATAIGYQHFVLKKGDAGTEIPFGDNLPRGSYELDADAVAEVAATNSIYRARLVPREKFQVHEGP